MSNIFEHDNGICLTYKEVVLSANNNKHDKC
jgi:hypothetical protein